MITKKRKLVDFDIEKDFNVDKIKKMTYDQFKNMVGGWVDKSIFKPTEAEIKSVFKKLTGGEVPDEVKETKTKI